MLAELRIRNIALIEELELYLKDGLNILSGETGAGKSIIIDSLNFVLGERADKSLVRYGADFATVEATFENYLQSDVKTYLDEVGIEPENVLILRRKMSLDGKNECRVNGRQVTLSTLKGLTELLVDIHGQHEHQSLLKSANHIALLDSVGGEKISALRDDFASAYAAYKDVLAKLSKFGDALERERRISILAYQIEEIERADIKEGEEESLINQRKRVRNMEKILTALQTAKGNLEGFDSVGVSAILKNTAATLDSISDFDEGVDPLVERLRAAKVEIDDISQTLSEMFESLDFDSRSADQLENRLEVVRNITRKYGGNYEALNKFYDDAREEYDMLSNADEEVEKLEAEKSKTAKSLVNAAEKLSESRRLTATKLEQDILRELKDLGMGSSTFKVDFSSDYTPENIGANGADRVEFLISPNAGEPLKPLAKIISGGEMSRFMLALKNILASVDGIGTMVFDEIDTGISGNISAVVSEKLCNISRKRQVIAVTHMPSLAAMADNHYLISKSEQNGKTLTHVTLLDDDTDEVARLIGGNDYSAYAIPHAKEMKAWAERFKKSLKI